MAANAATTTASSADDHLQRRRERWGQAPKLSFDAHRPPFPGRQLAAASAADSQDEALPPPPPYTPADISLLSSDSSVNESRSSPSVMLHTDSGSVPAGTSSSLDAAPTTSTSHTSDRPASITTLDVHDPRGAVHVVAVCNTPSSLPNLDPSEPVLPLMQNRVYMQLGGATSDGRVLLVQTTATDQRHGWAPAGAVEPLTRWLSRLSQRPAPPYTAAPSSTTGTSPPTRVRPTSLVALGTSSAAPWSPSSSPISTMSSLPTSQGAENAPAPTRLRDLGGMRSEGGVVRRSHSSPLALTPLPAAPPAATAAAEPQSLSAQDMSAAIRQTHALVEIVNTERSYLSDLLAVLHVFAEPLQEETELLAPAEHAAIFLNLEALITSSRSMLSGFQEPFSQRQQPPATAAASAAAGAAAASPSSSSQPFLSDATRALVDAAVRDVDDSMLLASVAAATSAAIAASAQPSTSSVGSPSSFNQHTTTSQSAGWTHVPLTVLHNTAYFQAHQQYCQGQSQAATLLSTLRSQRPSLNAWLTRAETTDARCRNLRLADLLLTPIQRVTRFPLLLDAVVSHSADNTAHRAAAAEAARVTRQYLHKINEAARLTHGRQRAQQLAALLESEHPHVAAWAAAGQHVVVAEGKLKMLVHSSLRRRLAEVWLILFEDMLFVLRSPSPASRSRNPLTALTRSSSLGRTRSGSFSFSASDRDRPLSVFDSSDTTTTGHSQTASARSGPTSDTFVRSTANGGSNLAKHLTLSTSTLSLSSVSAASLSEAQLPLPLTAEGKLKCLLAIKLSEIVAAPVAGGSTSATAFPSGGGGGGSGGSASTATQTASMEIIKVATQAVWTFECSSADNCRWWLQRLQDHCRRRGAWRQRRLGIADTATHQGLARLACARVDSAGSAGPHAVAEDFSPTFAKEFARATTGLGQSDASPVFIAAELSSPVLASPLRKSPRKSVVR